MIKKYYRILYTEMPKHAGNFKRRQYRKRKSNQIVKGGKLNNRMLQRGPFKKYNTVDPFPPGMFVKLTYTQSVVLSAGTGGVYGSENVFRLNSIYDPDYTGVGHQPYGHDTLSLIYGKYKVTGVKITIDWMNPNEDGVMCGAAIIQPNDLFATTGKAIDTLNEKPMAFSVNLNDSGKQRYRMDQYFPMHQLLGVTKAQFNNSINTDWMQSFGLNPLQSPRLAVACGSIAGSAVAGVTARVTLVYYTQLTERIVLAQS